MPSLAIFGFVGAAIVVAWFGTKELRRRKQARFVGRDLLTSDEFYERFYSGTGLDPVLVREVREQTACRLEIRSGLLRPTDRFDKELAPAEGWETWWDDGLTMLRSRGIVIGGRGRNVDWGRVVTLDDFIKQVARST